MKIFSYSHGDKVITLHELQKYTDFLAIVIMHSYKSLFSKLLTSLFTYSFINSKAGFHCFECSVH